MPDFHISGPTFEEFCKAYQRIEIPSYQRSYDWTEKEWSDLWLDIEPYVETDMEYFMGPVNAEKSPSGAGIRLADGQQRVTTLMMLLAALRTKASMPFSTRIGTVLFSNFAEVEDDDLSKLVLRLVDQTPEGRSSLISVLTISISPDVSQTRHRQAFTYFLDKIDSVAMSSELADRWAELVLSRLIFARVVAQGSGAGIKMFERSNNRGRPLTVIDRIKSLLIAAADINQADEVVANWTESVRALREADRFVEMTFVSWLAADYFDQEEKILRLSETYAEARKAVDAHGSISVSRDLLAYCRALRDIRKGLIPGTSFQCGSLANAEYFGRFAQLLRLLPAARTLERDLFIELARQVENTICVIAIAKAFPPDIERQIPKLLSLLRGQESRSAQVVAAFGILRKIRDDHSEGFGRVVYNGSYGALRKSYLVILWDLVEQYIENLNRNRINQKDRQAVNLSDYTVEHILAKSPKARNASKEYGVLDAPRDRQRFANLTPLESGNNYGIDPYSTKYRVYEGSKFYLTKTMSPRLRFEGSKMLRDKRKNLLAPYKTWTHKDLIKRAERLYGLTALALEFKSVKIEEEQTLGFQFESEASLPRMHDVRQLLSALHQFHEQGGGVQRGISTLRFLGLLMESEMGDDQLQLSQEGELLLTQVSSIARDGLTQLITSFPLLTVWRDLNSHEKKRLLDDETLRLYSQEKPLVKKQIFDCLEQWCTLLAE